MPNISIDIIIVKSKIRMTFDDFFGVLRQCQRWSGKKNILDFTITSQNILFISQNIVKNILKNKIKYVDRSAELFIMIAMARVTWERSPAESTCPQQIWLYRPP